jgi:hypothetical protein
MYNEWIMTNSSKRQQHIDIREGETRDVHWKDGLILKLEHAS